MKKIILILILLVTIFSCKETTSDIDKSIKIQTPAESVEDDWEWYYAEKFSMSPMQKNGIFILTLEYDKGKIFKDTIEIYLEDKNETSDIHKEIVGHKPGDFILTTYKGEVMNITTTGVMKNHYWYNDSMRNFIYLVDEPVRNYHPD